jgi:hypothetical protein
MDIIQVMDSACDLSRAIVVAKRISGLFSDAGRRSMLGDSDSHQYTPGLSVLWHKQTHPSSRTTLRNDNPV